MATELIKGKPVSEALTLTNKAVAEALDGLPAKSKMDVTVDRRGRELHFVLKYLEDTEKDDLE